MGTCQWDIYVLFFQGIIGDLFVLSMLLVGTCVCISTNHLTSFGRSNVRRQSVREVFAGTRRRWH